MILSSVRSALAPLGQERAAYPQWEDSLSHSRHRPAAGEDLAARFTARMEAAKGKVFRDFSSLAAHLRAQGWTVGYVDARVRPLLGTGWEGFTFHDTFDREQRDLYQFGLTCVAGGVAESGSLVLKDADAASRLATLAPWVHVAVLRTADLVPDVATAVSRFDRDSAQILVTGPSKTADIEGILIEGVHGPGQQYCVLLP